MYDNPLKEYAIGDTVAFYLPPNEHEAKRMGKNPKHMLQYQGPGRIVEALSVNNTAFKIKCGNRHYRRNVMHIAPYKAEGQVPTKLQLHVDSTVTEGTFVAVLDTDTDTKYHVAKVLEVGEQSTKLHYHATTSNRLRGAKWRPLYAHPRSNVVIMEKPETIIRNHLQYTGNIDTHSIENSLIILPNLGMTQLNCINARTRQILKRKTGYSHHRVTHTWDPNT